MVSSKSARGNLQVRRLTQASTAPFAAAVGALVEIASGPVVETPPLASDDPSEFADPRALAASIAARAAPLGDRLGLKVTVMVDGMGQITRIALKADIRLTAIASDRWVGAVAERKQAELSAMDAPGAVADILERLADLGPAARGTDLVSPAKSAYRAGKPPIGHFALSAGSATGIALPFGASDAASLIALARLAAQHDITGFRLAPHHALLAIDAPAGFATDAALGFITDPADPRLRVSACIGSMGCAAGFFAARALAERLAPTLPANPHLHVVGCSKGCAHPRRAEVTLVGRGDGYGLVINGMAGDTPHAELRADASESDLAATIRQG
ncbi:MAG: precorrin-3B synthase [Candidatus Devosia euplotis]|nr:precorrin-3B synthase [Candidatus Devosia euplotis]